MNEAYHKKALNAQRRKRARWIVREVDKLKRTMDRGAIAAVARQIGVSRQLVSAIYNREKGNE